jgi:hypothetical protein
MPKPVLSDSLFNADDVATAILNKANLQITNDQLGVTDITSSFTRQSPWTHSGEPDNVFLFMGFVFYNLGASTATSISNDQIVWNIATDYKPNENFLTNNITYQGDFSNYTKIQSDGTIRIMSPTQPSGSDATFRVYINGWFRISS